MQTNHKKSKKSLNQTELKETDFKPRNHKRSLIQNSIAETKLKATNDQNESELGTKPKMTRKARRRPGRRARKAKQSANEKSAEREQELNMNCWEPYCKEDF